MSIFFYVTALLEIIPFNPVWFGHILLWGGKALPTALLHCHLHLQWRLQLVVLMLTVQIFSPAATIRKSVLIDGMQPNTGESTSTLQADAKRLTEQDWYGTNNGNRKKCH